MSKEDIEAEVFAFLERRYVQRQDARQAAMGLQYTEAETHDLAKTLAGLFVRMAPRLQDDAEDADPRRQAEEGRGR